MKRNKYLEGQVAMLKNNQDGEKSTEKDRKSQSFFEGNSIRKYSNPKRRNLGWTGHSFYQTDK